MGHRISKARFVDGLRCPKLLWWKVHEPETPEVVPDPALQGMLERGTMIRELARTYVPGGVAIDVPHHDVRARATATRKALAGGARAIYGANFFEEGATVSIDILERRRNGFVLVDVKSSLGVKGEHIPGVALQLQVARAAGLDVKRAEVMHLNRACRHPDLSNLFTRENVTKEAKALAVHVPKQVRSLLRVLDGPVPEVATGAHCTEPYACPFLARCWPPVPEQHVSTLYRIDTKRVEALIAKGYEMLPDLPSSFRARGVARRQLRSVREGKTIVRRRALRKALARIEEPIAFLDFETICLPVPAWPGCRPYQQVPVQLSCHVVGPRGVEHHAMLAEGPDDPREHVARALIAACAGARTVLAYHATFEKSCIAGLIDAVPALGSELSDVADRILDLLPIVRDHVYHPAFRGSFSLKSVAPALVPELGYDDLEIRDGQTASLALEALLFRRGRLTADERIAVRRRLLRYCKRDTLSMLRVHEAMWMLAGNAHGHTV